MKRELTKYLKTLTEKELIAEVKKLYDKFDPVRKYYELELGGNSEKVLSEYKAKIEKEYFPARGFGKARSSVSRKVIADFKKISVFPKDLIDLMLYRTEMMLDFTNAYGDMDEAFYTSIESGFEQACKLIVQEKMEPYFRAYCEELIRKSNGLGYGVSEELYGIFEDHFE